MIGNINIVNLKLRYAYKKHTVQTANLKKITRPCFDEKSITHSSHHFAVVLSSFAEGLFGYDEKYFSQVPFMRP